jgi:hypothetical protein
MQKQLQIDKHVTPGRALDHFTLLSAIFLAD